MTVDINKVIAWFTNRVGRLTYSMTGSRNGADGTADCSGSITQALYEAGAAKYAYLYSTVTLASYLQANGYTCISRNQDWDSKKGDIILMSWGADMSSSGGAGGHVGVMKDDATFISTDYWTGGQAGTAVSTHNWNAYYAANQPRYIEVWRNSGQAITSPPSQGNNNQPKPPAQQSYNDKFRAGGNEFTAYKDFYVHEIKNINGMWQCINYDMAGWGSISSDQWKKNGSSRGTAQDWTENGIPLDLVHWTRGVGSNEAIQTGSYVAFDKGWDHGKKAILALIIHHMDVYGSIRIIFGTRFNNAHFACQRINILV